MIEPFRAWSVPKPSFLFYLISIRIFWLHQRPLTDAPDFACTSVTLLSFAVVKGGSLKMYIQTASIIVNGRSIPHCQFPIAIRI